MPTKHVGISGLGDPAFIVGPEFIVEIVRNWIAAVGAKTSNIEPGSLGENG